MGVEKFLLVLPRSNIAFFLVLTSTFLAFTSPKLIALPALEEKLSAISTIHTLFRHGTTNDATYYGELWIEKPNRFRIESSAPWKQTLVSDGIKFWNYDADLEQLTIDWLDKDLGRFPILVFTGSTDELDKIYNISSQLDQDLAVYQLIPKRENQYFSSIWLTFRDLVPISIVILDVMDNYTEFFFSSTQVNADLTDDLFEFSPPDDVELLDRTTKSSKL